MGLYVLYFGTRRQYPDVAHHTVWFGERYRELLTDIFKHKHLADDFSLYVHRPTATDPSFAPAGCDSFYVLCPVPNLRGGQDWAVEGPRLRDRIVAALHATLLPGLADTITAEFAMTPEDFYKDYDAEAGAGLADLYVVGAGAHPGAGVPGVLNSARTLERLLPARP
jgi:phytoene desaturase